MSEISLSPLQLQAFDACVEPKNRIVTIKGFAGTGKTTVLSKVAAALGNSCMVLAPTNKAASNIREKGIRKAMTIHTCLYTPMEVIIPKKDAAGNILYNVDKKTGDAMLDENGEKIPIIQEKRMSFGLRERGDGENLLPPIALVDESSMVGEDIYNDLINTFETVIFFGDEFQLAPVGGKDVFHKSTPDVFLDEVHRQALENPIVRYATDIRMGKEPNLDSILCHEIRTCFDNNSKLYESIVANDIQAISGTNAMRHVINEKIRARMGYKKYTLANGEKIVSCQNVRVNEGMNKILVFYNGQITEVVGDYEAGRDRDHYKSQLIKTKGPDRLQWMWPFWNEGFFSLKDNRQNWYNELERRKDKNSKLPKPVWGAEFDYAYCLTAHKAQGSEFGNVAVFDQRHVMKNKDEQARWFYTAITRAKQRLLVVKMA